MSKKIITIMAVSILPLLAQEGFLEGVRAEDLMLDRIEAPGAEDTIGISNWGKFFFNIANSHISPNNKMKVESLDDGICVTNLDNMQKKYINDRGCMPKWSPTGEYIAFLLQRPLPGKYWRGHQIYGGDDIWICEPDGENKKNLMPGVDIGDFQWSPDGKHIAFTYRDEERGKWALGIVDIETKERRFLDVFSPYDYAGFSFSPNGKLIAYCKPLKWKLEGDWYNTDAEVFVIDIDGTTKTQITKTEAVEKMVKWSSDGKKLIIRQSPLDPSILSYRQYVSMVLKRRNRGVR